MGVPIQDFYKKRLTMPQCPQDLLKRPPERRGPFNKIVTQPFGWDPKEDLSDIKVHCTANLQNWNTFMSYILSW